MRRVTFHGPSFRLLAYGHELLQECSASMEDHQAEALAANPRIDVTVKEAKSRPSLGKATLHITASPPGDAEPEADRGEGQPQNPNVKES